MRPHLSRRHRAKIVTYAHTCGASDRATTYRTIADNARSAWIHRCGALCGGAGSLVGVEFVGNLIVPTSRPTSSGVAGRPVGDRFSPLCPSRYCWECWSSSRLVVFNRLAE